MRIICLSDIHGSYARANAILKAERFDVLLIAGDLTTFGAAQEASSALESFVEHGKPVVGVAGNMDPPILEEVFERLNVSINGRGKIVQGVGFFGVSASPPTPLNTPYEISEDEIADRALRGWRETQGAKRRIFVPHAPPSDSSVDLLKDGRHVGSSSVRKFVEEFQPDALVCGHIHEARGTDKLGNTEIVNCGPAGKGYYAIIEINDRVEVRLNG